MATYPQAQGFDLGSILQAAQLGKALNPVNIQQEALNNQLALQLQQVQLQRAQQQLNDALNPEAAQQRSLNFLLAQENAKNPFSGLNVTPGGQIVQNPGALLPEQVAGLEAGTVTPEALNVPRGTPTIPVQGVNGPLEFGRSLDSMMQAGLNERKYNKILAPPIHGTPGTTFFEFNPETNKYEDIASVAQKGEKATAYPHIDRGNSIDFVDPITNEVISSFPKNPDAKVHFQSDGFYVEQTPGKGDFKFVAKTPTQASPAQQFQVDALDRSITAIDDLIKRTNDSTTGRAARLQGSSFYPGVLQTDAYANYAADLDSIKSGVFLTQIAAMKATSKTGSAGLGAISNKEGDRLESAYASLRQNQSPENVRKNLTIAKDAIQKYKDALTKYGNTPSAQPSQNQAITPSGPIKINSIRLKPQP